MKSLFMIDDWQSIFNHDVSLFFPILIKGMPRLFFCFLHQIGKKWAVKTEGRIYGCTIYTIYMHNSLPTEYDIHAECLIRKS